MKNLIILSFVFSENMASASWVSENLKKAESWVDRRALKQHVEQASVPVLAQVAATTRSIKKTSTPIDQNVADMRTPLLTPAWLLAGLFLSAAVRSLLMTIRLLVPVTARVDRPEHDATTRASAA